MLLFLVRNRSAPSLMLIAPMFFSFFLYFSDLWYYVLTLSDLVVIMYTDVEIELISWNGRFELTMICEKVEWNCCLVRICRVYVIGKYLGFIVFLRNFGKKCGGWSRIPRERMFWASAIIATAIFSLTRKQWLLNSVINDSICRWKTRVLRLWTNEIVTHGLSWRESKKLDVFTGPVITWQMYMTLKDNTPKQFLKGTLKKKQTKYY